MHTLTTTKISKLWTCQHQKTSKATWTWQIYVWSHPKVDWKFFLPPSAWPTTSTASHSFSWKRAWFCQSRWVGASQVWKMPPLLHRCKRSKAQRNWIWLQNLCKAFMSFWLPWTIPQAEKYLLNIAANYILYKMQEFFYFPHKFVMFSGNLSGDKGQNYLIDANLLN